MGCNCKKTASAASKYTDDETFVVPRGINKLFSFIGKLILACLVFAVMIVACPLMICYTVFCLVTGRSLKLTIFRKKRNVRE